MKANDMEFSTSQSKRCHHTPSPLIDGGILGVVRAFHYRVQALPHITQHGMGVAQLRYERGILFLSHLGSSESKIESWSISDMLFLPHAHLPIEARRPAWPPCTEYLYGSRGL